ncbi:hypothetical protein [Streptomyces sp. AF1B]|jgi:hypothetical protein|uniref:hypothetical protein n=1 Tax=Streptomyces sp. AF1B TaxID=3399503 RepID=UPI003AAC4F4B
MLTTFPLRGCPWPIVHLLLFNLELESGRQKGDGRVKRSTAHSFTLTVAVEVARRRLDLASRPVLTEANLDAERSPTCGQQQYHLLNIASYEVEAFADGSHARVLGNVGPLGEGPCGGMTRPGAS